MFTGAALSFAVAGNALADEGKITVFAAASLTNAMQDIATQFKKEKGVDVVSSFASSSTLARQIEAGAPADLFISADQKWMDYAVDKKAIDTASRQTLLGNSLVVVAPKASEQKKHCKNWAHGIRSPRNWLRRKMFVARWRWSNAMKRRWALFTVLTQLPAKG